MREDQRDLNWLGERLLESISRLDETLHFFFSFIQERIDEGKSLVGTLQSSISPALFPSAVAFEIPAQVAEYSCVSERAREGVRAHHIIFGKRSSPIRLMHIGHVVILVADV